MNEIRFSLSSIITASLGGLFGLISTKSFHSIYHRSLEWKRGNDATSRIDQAPSTPCLHLVRFLSPHLVSSQRPVNPPQRCFPPETMWGYGIRYRCRLGSVAARTFQPWARLQLERFNPLLTRTFCSEPTPHSRWLLHWKSGVCVSAFRSSSNNLSKCTNVNSSKFRRSHELASSLTNRHSKTDRVRKRLGECPNGIESSSTKELIRFGLSRSVGRTPRCRRIDG